MLSYILRITPLKSDQTASFGDEASQSSDCSYRVEIYHPQMFSVCRSFVSEGLPTRGQIAAVAERFGEASVSAD